MNKALKKKTTDDEINNFKDQSIKNLTNEKGVLNERIDELNSNLYELKLLAEYLSNQNKRDAIEENSFLGQFKNDISRKDKAFCIYPNSGNLSLKTFFMKNIDLI